MIRATAGVWMNYATTVIFQIVFAVRFGSGLSASVFVVASGIVLALGSIVAATVQSLVVPRVVVNGGLSKSALRLVGKFTIVAIFTLTLVAVFPRLLAGPIAHTTAIDALPLATALRVAAIFMIFQTLASEAGAIAIARGMRFIPAVAPAFPTIAGAVYLTTDTKPSIEMTLVSMAVGAAVELAFIVIPLSRGVRVVPDAPMQLRAISLWTAAQFGALTLMAPLERVLASVHGTEGAAEYNYAIRSLAIAQQLLVGGLVLSSLGDWSRFALRDRSAFKSAIWRATGLAIVLLVFAASMAVVAGQSAVRLVYQHGSFTPSDTVAVTHLLFLALPGFCAEGVGLVLAQGLLAARRNDAAVTLGFLSFGIRTAAVVLLGLHWGVEGVAAGYSVGAVVSLAAFVFVVMRLHAPEPASAALLKRVLFVAGGTAAIATVCGVFGTIDVVMRVVLIAGVFALLSVAAHMSLIPTRWWRHA
jgi:putative peptidoglycan lipid II flippase